MLSISNLNKSFQGKPILKNLTFQLKTGEITVILGESGAGKSTLLRCLTGLEPIESGKMTLDGISIDLKQNQFNLQGKIGLVFQNFNLFPHLSVLDNVMLSPLQQFKLPHTQVRNEAMSLLKLVNLSDKAHNYPQELSGGQQQRVAIARACALNPKVLCFDEPTSALDPLHTQLIIDLMKELKFKGLTLLIITHDLSFAHQVADRLFTLDQGHLFPTSLNF